VHAEGEELVGVGGEEGRVVGALPQEFAEGGEGEGGLARLGGDLEEELVGGRGGVETDAGEDLRERLVVAPGAQERPAVVDAELGVGGGERGGAAEGLGRRALAARRSAAWTCQASWIARDFLVPPPRWLRRRRVAVAGEDLGREGGYPVAPSGSAPPPAPPRPPLPAA
jgi:hypothetical protein